MLCVEVKGCSRLYQIPDLFSSEIDRDTLRLIGDELCVVYIIGDEPIRIARIPRDALLPEHIKIKYGYRAASSRRKAVSNPTLLLSRIELRMSEGNM